MIAVDTNILVHAHRNDSDWHEPARDAIKLLAEGSRVWGIPWQCIAEFVATVTHPRILQRPSTVDEVTAQIRAWMRSPGLHLLSETPSTFDRFAALLASGKIAGPRAHDARIAAICLANHVHELWTADRDFSRFPDLRTRNPLAG